jgi:hypothetical protein
MIATGKRSCNWTYCPEGLQFASSFLGKGFVGSLKVNLVPTAMAWPIHKLNNPSPAETSLEGLPLNPSTRGQLIGRKFQKGTNHPYFTLSAFLFVKLMYSIFAYTLLNFRSCLCTVSNLQPNYLLRTKQRRKHAELMQLADFSFLHSFVRFRGSRPKFN